MMEREPDNFTFSHVVSALTLFVFGWSIFWMGANSKIIVGNVLRSGQLQNSSLSSMAGANDAVDSSSNIGEPANKTVEDYPTIKIAVGGDVMFDRSIRAYGQKHGYDQALKNVATIFKESDIGVVNLEGPITSKPSKTLLPNNQTTKSLVFTFAPNVTKALADSGIGLVSLANNHTDNFGISGLNETKKYLSNEGIAWFGSPWNSSSTEAIITRQGATFAFVGYHEFQKGYSNIITDIKRLSKEGYFVIVMPHWGEEYVSVPSEKMTAMARDFVAAGAKAVIGSHPHVTIEHVWIGDVPVFYSLGNLLFDQYFKPEVMQGNIVELTLSSTPDGPQIKSVRIYETKLDKNEGVIVVGDKVIER